MILNDIKEGDVLQWQTVNSLAKGYVVVNSEGEKLVFLEDGHSFRLVDIVSATSLKVTGHIRVK